MSETLSVREVCEFLQRTIEDRFEAEIWVRGAISGLNRSSGGHVYFDLVEPSELGRRPDSVLPVALFANAKFRVNAILKKSNAMRMDDGIEIRVRGRLVYYGAQSRVQLVMSLIDPTFTIGQLELSRAKLLAELEAEGLLDANRRLPTPVLPLRIAVVTSAASAAEADFVNELHLSGLPFELLMVDSRVQGNEAVSQLVAAIEASVALEPDLIAIVRGGGARTDLMAFDHGDVARAIARSPIPVVVGIGHETDRSVADHVAHLSTKTPTACAATIVGIVTSFIATVDDTERRLRRVVEQTLVVAAHRLDRAGSRIGLLAGGAVERQHAQLLASQRRCVAAVDRCLERNAATLERLELQTNALDPRRVLARGWSITHTTAGRLVRSADDAPVGTTLITTLAEGTITSHRGAD